VSAPAHRAGAVAFLLATALTILLVPAAAGSAAITKCADVMFVGARGSGELEEAATDGMGVPIDYMGKQLAKQVLAYGETFAFRQVPYSADSVDELVPSGLEIDSMKAAGVVGIGAPEAGVAGLTGAAAIYYARHAKPYLRSIADGIAKTIARVKQLTGACPEAELILAGYSQGAMAIHQAELQLQREGDEEALIAIGGTLLLGDGDRVPNTAAKLIGGAPRGGEGVRVYLHGVKPRDVAEPETTAEICVANDIVCDFRLQLDRAFYSQGAHIHSEYKDNPQRRYLDLAVDWLAHQMGLSG
jgi:cutinase